ncbi:MAG: hypothetical protein KJ600_00590 [Nanoarchaeota archaeon]|nr:hypothetical protein [Nanoarchaeota archaeon]MBU1103040.1 hypothetical protein [Nanoarchaeota archaeon]
MLDEKRIEIIKKNVERLIKEELIIRVKEDKGRFTEFFLKNSRDSLESAKLLLNVSTKAELKALMGIPGFNGFLWTINASYYSMFYMARALLENAGIKIKTELSVHSIVFDALVCYFYLTGKIEKSIIEEFNEAEEEANEILGKEKAKGLIEDYFHEKDKRGKFTYEMGAIVMQNKAQTSLERAKRFNEEIRKIID